MVEVLHASFTDYLFDKSRSQKFYIELSHHATYFMRMSCRVSVTDTIQTVKRRLIQADVRSFCRHARPTEELFEDLLSGFKFLAEGHENIQKLGPYNLAMAASNRDLIRIAVRYLEYFSLLKMSCPNLSANIHERYREHVKRFIESQIELYRSDDVLITLLVLSLVNLSMMRELVVRTLFSPQLEFPDHIAVIKVDDSTVEFIESTLKDLKDGDFTRTAKVMVSSLVHATTKDGCGSFDHAFALASLPYLLQKASNDPKLIALLQAIELPLQSISLDSCDYDGTCLKAERFRSESMVGDESQTSGTDITEKDAKVDSKETPEAITTITEGENQERPQRAGGLSTTGPETTTAGERAGAEMANGSDGENMERACGEIEQRDVIQVTAPLRKARWARLWARVQKKFRHYVG
ncbi:unnamed protein product [Cyclocybe aegerita]|uniref:Uncharacterized protein n=1 Tax=Cyclocybe aegerita TaxID=1973307 RepID=A0A8S0W4Q1_CYCAE|nr:unnamed protein product [Cyclocybe aegerita]